MPPLAAKILVIAATAVSLAVWWWGLSLFRKIRAMPNILTRSGMMGMIGKDAAGKELVRLLAALSYVQLVKKRESGADLVLGASEAAFLAIPVKVEFRESVRGTSFEMVADIRRLNVIFQWILGVLVVVVAPVTILGIALLIWFLAIPHEKPSVRWQAVQVVQMIHVLWPPLVLYTAHRRYRLMAETHLEKIAAVLENLPS